MAFHATASWQFYMCVCVCFAFNLNRCSNIRNRSGFYVFITLQKVACHVVNVWKRDQKESERARESVCEVCVCTLYTHYTLMTYFIHPSIYFIFHTPSMDGLHEWGEQKKETYLPGFCFIRILNKHTHALTMENIKKLHVFCLICV